LVTMEESQCPEFEICLGKCKMGKGKHPVSGEGKREKKDFKQKGNCGRRRTCSKQMKKKTKSESTRLDKERRFPGGGVG